MDRDAWAAYTTDTEMQRRAGGRRHYNAVRRFRAELRRRHLAAWLRADAGGWSGQQARAARALGVSEATISRDLARMQAVWLEEQAARQGNP